MCAYCAWGIEAGFAGTLAFRAVYVAKLRALLARAADGEPLADEPA